MKRKATCLYSSMSFMFLLTLFFRFSCFSQQPLNLGFEKLSVEGPWGWTVSAFAPGISFACDSNMVNEGKYSLKVTASSADTLPFELTFFVEPAMIHGRKLHISGWVRQDTFKGKAGIRLQTLGSDGGDFLVLDERQMEISPVATGAWTEYETAIHIDPRAHSVQFTVFVSGTGELWFDRFQARLDGEVIVEIPVAPDFTKSEQRWITENAVPLPTGMETMGHPGSEYFRTMAGDARIIALGESTHGTSEFFRIKHQLLKYAVTEMGVRAFVLEDNQLLAERVNEYVLYGRGEAKEVIKGLFAVWNTQEMLELIDWLRRYNQEHPHDMVEFTGMDIQNPQLALEKLRHFLSSRDTALLSTADEFLAIFEKEWRNSYSKGEHELLDWYKDAGALYRLMEDRKNSWFSQAATKQEKEEIEWAVQYARLIYQCTSSMLTAGFEGRDSAMAQNIGWILDRMEKDSRIIVWAHDSHISRGDAEEPPANYFLGNSMGAHLSRKYGNDYRAFALFTYQGKCRGVVSYSNFRSIEFDLFTSPRGSLDEGLHQAAKVKGSPFLLLDLRPLKNNDPASQWLTQKRPARYVGYVAEDYGFGGRYSLPYQFDGVIFVDVSTASQPVK